MKVLPNKKKSGHVLVTGDDLRWLEVWTGSPGLTAGKKVFLSIAAFPCSSLLKSATKTELSAGGFVSWSQVHSAFTLEEVDALIALLQASRQKVSMPSSE